ncbi:histidine kinase dimerization/phosphoacceptor domain-containing protein [Actinoplanes sp. NPDC023801]|uniref:histidine kinase dimerization/phosphoacceptor domain-containing protein n=1 Tax=Actinoplanes sp. NPDC023801 TaxID=3154595 RepID=UPI0033C5F3B5
MPDGTVARLRRDLTLAGAAAAPALLELAIAVRQGWRTVLAAAIVLVPALLLALRRRSPVLAFAAVLSVNAGGLLLAVAARAETSAWSGVPAVVVTFFLAVYLQARQALIVAGAGLAVVVIAILNTHLAPAGFRGGAELPLTLLAVAAAWALGGQWRAVRVELSLAGERAGRAVREERERIARDMHDVTGHHLTPLVVRAEALRARRADLPGWAAAEIDELAADARRAVNDVRGTLRLLGSPAPAPGLGDLAELVGRVRSAGNSGRLPAVRGHHPGTWRSSTSACPEPTGWPRWNGSPPRTSSGRAAPGSSS